MKIFLKVFLMAALVIPVKINSQIKTDITNDDVDGIYITLNDFQINKIAHPIDKLHKTDRLKLNQFFNSPNIITWEQDKETVFYKDSIFGIKLNCGDTYRFINGTPCLIVDTSYLYIYENKTIKHVVKHSGPRTLRKDVHVTYYYFSLGNHNAFFTLNMENIVKFVIHDTTLNQAFNDRFASDQDLVNYDKITKEFELNKALKTVLKKKQQIN